MKVRKHVLVCTKEGPGRCGSKGGMDVFMAMRRAARDLGLDDEVLVTQCGCTGQHDRGPTVIVHPDGVWYGPVAATDAECIMAQHGRDGQTVLHLKNDGMSRLGGA